MKRLYIASALLALGCRSTHPEQQGPEAPEAAAASVSAVRTGEMVVTTKIEEQGDETYALLVEIERVRENGSRELLGAPRVLLESGQNAAVDSTDGDNTISVLATLPAAGGDESALIAISMFEGDHLTAAPRIRVPLPTVTRPTPIAADGTPADGTAVSEPSRVISVAFHDEDVHTVVASIARQAEKDIVISEAIQGRVTLNVRDVSWYRALELALEPLALTATAADEEGEVLLIKRSPTVTQHCQVWLNFIDEDFQRVVSAIAEQAKVNVIVDSGIAGNLTLRAEGVSWPTALETAAEAVGCTVHVSRDGTLVRVVPE